jgi:diketogulonate reductase-like aldo/keto reductase
VAAQRVYNLSPSESGRTETVIHPFIAKKDIVYVPFFSLREFAPLQSSTLSGVAAHLDATPMPGALAWLLRTPISISTWFNQLKCASEFKTCKSSVTLNPAPTRPTPLS